MQHQESDDKRLSQIMKKSMVQMPFSDFEDKVMVEIHRQARYKKAILANIRLSRLFFFLGLGAGLIINDLLSHLHHSLMGLSAEQILLVFQVSFVFFFLTQLDKIFKPLTCKD
jgi:TRAP-type C4-dicarboxylate transport system permease small subunit